MVDQHPARLLAFPRIPDSRAANPKPWLATDAESVRLADHLRRIARSDASVLIVGETGTGKEVAARHIHEHSGRQGPFVAINCAALSEQLIDAELFGHEAGAFTGASSARAGWFETADGGTLFLDEIGDMPLNLQVKLLRVLQEKQVVRLGSRKSIALDVRVVAATNVDLLPAVQARRFRGDLYYRLSVTSVRLAPLRERPGDILPFAEHFIARLQPGLGLEQVSLSPRARNALLGYAWPGNVREVENVIHHGLIMCRNGVLESEDLRIAESASSATQAPPGLERLSETLRQLIQGTPHALYESVERLLLSTALAHCRGNQVHTARRLGVSRNVLRTQLKRFGLLKDAADRGEPEDDRAGSGIWQAMTAVD